VHLLHVTQTPLEPATLVILSFWFLALVVVDAPHCSVVKEAYNLAFSSRKIFQVWVPSPSLMVTLPYESIFGSGFLVFCVFLKLLLDI
jgi:hypothetical protein